MAKASKEIGGNRMSIVMTGGGTGGHLAIVKAVKEKLVGDTDKSVQRSVFSVQDGVSQSDTENASALSAQRSMLPTQLVYIGSTQGQDTRQT